MTRSPVALLVVVATLSLTPAPARACGPHFDTAYFTFATHPDAPFEPYAAGQIGVLRPTYARSYLAVAYRHLQGVPTSAEDQASVVALWERRLRIVFSAEAAAGDPERAWLEARSRVAEHTADLPPLDSINPYHPLEGGYYWSYLNCNPDAFHTAAVTLEDLVERRGEKNKHVQEWVRGQDQVFANCDGQARTVPVVDAARAGYWSRAPREFRQHRAYQIAAAHFYVGEYDDAHRRFLAIAADGASPWSAMAPYLAARALVRKGMFAAGDGAADAATLAAAEQQIAAVLADASREAIHPSAQALNSYVQLYLHPETRVHALAATIAAPGDGVPLGTALDDYTRLLDRFVEWDRYQGLDPQADDLTDWILTYQTPGDEARDHALARWQQTRSTAWLIAALSKVPADHPELTELLVHALQIEAGDPGFLTVRQLWVEQLLARGLDQQPRVLLDDVLVRDDLPRGARNLLLAQRLRVAADLDEVVAYLPRTPVCTGGDELRAVHDCAGTEQPVLIDAEGARLLDRSPLSQVAELAQREQWPPQVRRNVARAGWVRAALTADDTHGVALARLLISLDPALTEALQPYIDATDSAERSRAALFAMLQLPGLRPQVEAGLPRRGPWSEIDSFRDNWWCAAGDPLDASGVGTAPNYLCQQAVAWAQADPGDPRVPEALHRAVKATRYGCTDEETGRWSKETFQTLHRQYPDSPWTAKTPYWFK